MKIDCPSWRDLGLAGVGQCIQNKFGGRPSHGTCAMCLGRPMSEPSTIALPVLLNEAQRERVISRRKVCQLCEHAMRLSRLAVHCEGCGCAGLSLLNGKCPRDKWPAQPNA